jgi:hypothetical protein
VRVDGLEVELVPEGPVLITRHRDRPGMLGRLGTLVGSRGLNIRRAELGPAPAANGLASAFLSLEARPPDALVAEIAGLDGIESCRLVEL